MTMGEATRKDEVRISYNLDFVFELLLKEV
jgi:hypothetical protein